MLRRIESEERPSSLSTLALSQSEPVVAAIHEADFDAPLLPHDHPPWVKDALTLSRRARESLAHIPRAAITVLTFWDHRVRSIFVAGSRLSIDASGSYRLE